MSGSNDQSVGAVAANGQISAGVTAASQVTLPDMPEIRRWIEKTQQERAGLQARAARLREQFEPLRQQLHGIERSIKVLDHFLAQVTVAGHDGPSAARAGGTRRGALLPAGQWSRAHAQCRACGTTAKRHKAQGLCSGCYDSGAGRA